MSDRISVYKVEQTEYVTRAFACFDRINSRKVRTWNAVVDGKLAVTGMPTRRQAKMLAEKIISRRG